MDIISRMVPLVLEGGKTTLGVFAFTLLFSLPLALPVALCRISKIGAVRKITAAYIYVMRGTPLLLQLMFVFFGLPLIPVVGLTLGRYTSILVAFVLNYTAYYSEILRGGIQSMDPGQWEAGKMLGLSKSYTFLKIILPQVLKRTWPAIANEIITLVKDTSLVYVLGVMDILKAAKSVSNATSSILPYVYIGVIYLVAIGILTVILERIEGKLQHETEY
ncbi:MAG: amino acid ABC transporter permease [Tissierellia bacterium]|nr:amino acid ABC transporter permease [Tissierellia bacterium]